MLCLLLLLFTGQVVLGEYLAGAKGVRSWRVQTALPVLQPETCCPPQDASSQGAAFQSAMERASLGKQLCIPPLSAAHLVAVSSLQILPFHQHKEQAQGDRFALQKSI